MADPVGWTTPSDLGEYVFCPRAHFYRLTRGAPSSPATVEGTSYHRRHLAAERWRDGHRRLPWLAVCAGLALLAAAVAVLLG